jgi:hypothetical protein
MIRAEVASPRSPVHSSGDALLQIFRKIPAPYKFSPNWRLKPPMEQHEGENTDDEAQNRDT